MSDKKFTVGDGVKMSRMWKHESAEGVVIRLISSDYVVVKWDGINGEWHYTLEQAKRLVSRDPE